MASKFLFIFFWIGLVGCMAQNTTDSAIGDFKQQSEKNDSLANSIIDKVIQYKSQNAPDAALNTYSYNNYTKVLVSADREAINGTIDSIFKRKRKGLKFKKIDSTNYIIKRQLEKSHLYIMEKVS